MFGRRFAPLLARRRFSPPPDVGAQGSRGLLVRHRRIIAECYIDSPQLLAGLAAFLQRIAERRRVADGGAAPAPGASDRAGQACGPIRLAPICIGEFYRRLVGRILSAKLKPEARAVLALLHQLGSAVGGGVEVIVHAVQQAAMVRFPNSA